MSESCPIQVLSNEECYEMMHLHGGNRAVIRAAEAAILAKLADTLKDAERYRWLKANCVLGIKQNGIGWSLNTRQGVAPDGMHQIDAAIDAQISLTLKKSD